MVDGSSGETDGTDSDDERRKGLPGHDRVDRRGFLKAAGAAAAVPLVAATSRAAPSEHLLEIRSTEDPAERGDLSVTYEFTATGEITKATDEGRNSAEGNDRVVENDDGTWTAVGKTGNGFGDAFRFEGRITDFTGDGAFELRLDGDVVAVDDLVGAGDSVVEVVTTEDPSELSYQFTATGEIQPYTDNGDNSAEDNDTISQNSDGTWSVDGYTGNGYGDAFFFQGELTAFSPVEGSHEVYVDGQRVDLSAFEPRPEHVIEIVTTEDPYDLSYQFTTTGEIQPHTDNGGNSAEGNDSVAQNADGTWSVDGYTGNGYGDAFFFDGDLENFGPVDGSHEVYVDGQRVDLSAFGSTTDSDASDDTDVAMGGGKGYANTVPESEATTVVASADGLANALSGASSGDVVYVDGDATIELGSRKLTVPGGVTLASDRGIDGSEGGLLTTDDQVWPSFEVESGARVTGLRFSGPLWDYVDYMNSTGMGFRCYGTVEVDNCELSGLGHAAVRVEGDSTVHHCDIHHNPMDGLGYGVLAKGGNPTVEYCTFDANRHSISSDGSGGYTVRHNHFGPLAHDHVIDAHRPGGTTMEIYNNTVEAVDESDEPTTVPAVTIRGVPDNVARIEDNWFYNPKEPRSSPSGWTHEAIVQAKVDSWRNVEFSGNAYGSTEPADDVGCPR